MSGGVADPTAEPSPPSLAIPTTSDGLTPAWIAGALAAGGLPGVRITAVERHRIGDGVGMLSELYRLRLTYAPGSAPGPAGLVAKLQSSSPEVREICAAYGMYEREVCFYSKVAATIELRTPEHYFSAFDPATGDCVILMEDMSPAVSPDQVSGITLSQLTQAIVGIANLHARWWGDPRLRGMRAIMPRAAEPPYANVAEIYRSALPVALDALKARGHEDLIRIAERVGGSIEGMLEAIAAEPLTLGHGDFRVDNLMFRQTPDGQELTVIDWQVVMQVRGPFDVGYLMGGAAPTDLRREHETALLRLYHDTLVGGGVTGYSFEDCLLDYRRAVLFSLVYWVEGCPLVDKENARAVTLFETWADRLAAAVTDLDLEALTVGLSSAGAEWPP